MYDYNIVPFSSEHRFARGLFGFWTEEKILIDMSSKEVPFMIKNGKHGVEIVDALSAAALDLDVVYDHYEPSHLSLGSQLCGFFHGIRQKGLQTTEEILREGSFITAVGQIELDGKVLRMRTSNVGPMLLTAGTKSTLLKKFEEQKFEVMGAIVVCSVIGVILFKRYWKKYCQKNKKEREERLIKETLEKNRKELSAPNLNIEQTCIVCTINPKEIIVLPCGHVCLCEDCSKKIEIYCPVCRAVITKRAAAFIS